MSHVRKQVRDAVGTLLSAAPVKWQRVFKARSAPARDVLPYLLVYIADENSDAQDIHAGFLQLREMTLSVSGRVRIVEGEALEDSLDAMAAEIETTLTTTALKAQLGNKLKHLELVSSRPDDDATDEHERTYAEIALDWRVQVHTAEGAPETLI